MILLAALRLRCPARSDSFRKAITTAIPLAVIARRCPICWNPTCLDSLTAVPVLRTLRDLPRSTTCNPHPPAISPAATPTCSAHPAAIPSATPCPQHSKATSPALPIALDSTPATYPTIGLQFTASPAFSGILRHAPAPPRILRITFMPSSYPSSHHSHTTLISPLHSLTPFSYPTYNSPAFCPGYLLLSMQELIHRTLRRHAHRELYLIPTKNMYVLDIGDSLRGMIQKGGERLEEKKER